MGFASHSDLYKYSYPLPFALGVLSEGGIPRNTVQRVGGVELLNAHHIYTKWYRPGDFTL